jgi:hypothetical protein
VQGAIARGMMVRRERLGSARVPSTELPNLSTISAPEGSRSRRAVPSRYETEWPSVSVRPCAVIQGCRMSAAKPTFAGDE